MVQRLRRGDCRSIVLALIVPVLALACGEGNESSGDEPSRTGFAGMPRTFPSSALRLSGPPDLVLAEGEHGIQLTLAEYNARVEESPLPAGTDTTDARRQTFERLVFHKVVAAEGRRRGYGIGDATTTLEAEIELARQVMRTGMVEAQSADDDAARAFLRDHPDEFPGIEAEDLEDPNTLLHVKFTMHHHRWRERLESWIERENVVVHHDRFAELMEQTRTGKEGR